MRPQQNRRMRGRAGNGSARRNSSPLTRSYESNGPDVKIRGTPQHIADKYAALARDAQASGDYVTAENYLQHAEHYMRIILSVQSQANITPPVFSSAENEEDNNDEEERNANTISSALHTDHTDAQSKSDSPSGVDGIPLELAFAVENGSGREFSSPSKEKIERPRKIRRRLSRKIEPTSLVERTLSVRNGQQEDKTMLSVTMPDDTENSVTDKLVVDFGIKPRRGRRVITVEK